MKYLFSFLLICLVGLSFSFGQKVTYYGEIIDYDSERKINGVTVRVLHNGSEVASVSTAGGKYTLQFDPGKNYVIEYVKAGYVTKVIHVDVTGFHEEDLPPGGKIFPPINIDLFTERTGADFSFLKTEPVVKWYFDRDKMSYDARQASAMKKKITDKLAEAEAANKNAEAQYNALIQEADKLFNDKSYEDALGKYGEALQIPGKETEPHPSNRIIEIGNILQKQAEEELSFKQENQAYLNLIEAADNLAEQKEYDKALLKYEEAIELNSEEQYPYDRIDQIKEIVALERRREEYNQLITRADMFFNQNSIEAARDKYEEALRLFNDEQYPKDQLAKINKELDEQSEIRQRRENYNRAVEAGDKHFDNEEYEQAIEKYREAITYESASTYPSDRIAMAKSRLEEIQAEKEKKENFDRLVQEGNEKVEEKAYETAISKYNEALGLIDDAEVKALRENAQQLLDEQLANAEQQATFDALVAEGNAQVDAKNYETAISKYNEALDLIDDAEVKALRENAQQLLDEQLANAEQQATFDALVAEGNAQVDAKNYETAISKYNEALGLIDDAEVKALRENAQQLLNAQLANAEQQATFDALVAEGNAQVDAKNYETAISKYNEALGLIDDAEVKALRENAQQLLNAQLANAEQQSQIEQLMASASEKMSNKDYAGAISDYSSVLALDVQHAEAIEGKGQAERLLEEQQENQAQQSQFSELVAQADEAFQNENWEDAKTKYIAAKSIISDNQHVNDRITEIQSIQETLANKERLNEEIEVLLTQAENLKMSNSWGQVIQKYEEALNLDNERSDIQELLNQAKESQAAWNAAQSQDELFEQLKREGETYMASEKWTDAKTKFEEALAINEDEEITAHLTFIEQKINEAAANELVEANYQAKMKAGEDFAKAEEFQKALNAFQEALEIKENDPIANSRIADMQQKLEGLEKQDEKEERYSLAMEAGKEAMTAEDFAAAIKHFDDALLEKPMDNEANRLLVEAKNKIEALKSEEERYEAFLSEGNSLLTLAKSNNNHIPTLEEAKAKFREAQLMRPQASLPQNKIVEIDNLLRQIEEEQEALKNQNVELQYQEKIELANIAAQGENYQNAINYLKEASDLKPNEQYPKDKIEEYQNIIDQIANQQAIEAQYKDLINKADLAFDNKQYQNSISLYNQALAIKENEAYPKGQIAKAKQAIEDANEGAEEQQYLSFISQGDQKFTNKSFEEALTYYEAALGVKENDSYAKDRVSEIKQILDNLKTKEAEEQAKRALYEKHIAEADALFNSEDYIEAKKRYDQAVYVIPNDVYAIERAQLSERKAKEKTEEEDNALYQKIIAKADEYFDDDSFDQARELYERALNLRSYDRYPQDKINEIIALQNANVKTNSNVEYLGEKQNISIMEGAALLEAGARQREQMKLENVQAHLRKNEGIARDLAEKDLLERHAYENEIVSIRDRRNNLYLEVQDKQHEFAQYVDEMAEGLEKHQKQIYDFHTGDVNRIYRDVEYIEIAYEEMLSQYKEDHQGIIDQVDIIEKGREVQARAELARHRDGVEATSQEILSTEKKNEDHYALSRIKQQELEVSVDDIIKGRELRTFEETNDLYDKISQLEADALLAEIRVSDAKDEKLAINKQLEDDIYALDAALKRKQEVESDEAYDTQMQIDGQLLAASNHYEATIQGKDETRQLIVDRVKDLEKSQEVQAAHRAEKHYQETQNITTDAENIMIQREESVIQQAKDLAAVDRAIKNQEEAFSRASHERNQEESRQRHATMNQLERIKKDEEITKMEGAQKAQNNYEDVKGLSASIDDNTQADLENLRDRAVRTQELVDQLESNKLTYSPLIANTIGDEYPEGVTQENYIRRDNNGIPVQIVTRRFVVQEGHGDIYIRIQTRNGITYSKNGDPITEQSWINGTENANLEKHF